MPRPIPPPPAQPSVEDTRDAVRLIRGLAVFALVIFLAFAQTVHLRGFFVEYGREVTSSWLLWKTDRLREDRLRAHTGGRVVWLVGSSILRESFDEDAINATLGAEGSPWRVSKFGQNRGASGLTSGLLERLPLREGDLVLHSVGMENFLRDWLDRTGVPWWQVTMLVPLSTWMRASEWSPQEKIEILLSRPATFWQFQRENERGWLRWIEAPWDGLPRRKTRHYTLTFHKFEADLTDDETEGGPESEWYLGPEDIDLSEGQFNVMGLRRMEQRCAERGATLVLADIPPRERYVRDYMAPEVAELWQAWRDARPDLLRFPQLPDADYYDMKHPNFRGRQTLSAALIGWLQLRDPHQIPKEETRHDRPRD